MATPQRVWNPGMIYHITSRGNRKEIIFRESADYFVYLMFVKEAVVYYSEYNYELISYCLMSNHVHLMLKCNDCEPSHIMRRINSKYTRYFNEKYDYVGHLFQGRYYAEPITNINHLIETSRYIHNNPVEAKIVEVPEDYKWSSCDVYFAIKNYRINHIKTVDTIRYEDIKKEEVMKYFNNVDEYKKYVKQAAPGERE